MIDANAEITLPGTGLIVPEAILMIILIENAERVSQAKREQLGKFPAAVRIKKRIARPCSGIVTIFIFGDDIKIAAD